MKRISFAHTQEQVLNRTKTVTRRLGWKTLTSGTRLLAVDKVMGFRRGDPPAKVLGTIEVTEVTREKLEDVSQADVYREGFPQLNPRQFVEMFCLAMGCDQDAEVTRIEFRYVDESA